MPSSSISNEIADWVRDVVASARSTPEETEIYFEKLTGVSELDELGVDLETLLDGSLKITSPPQELSQIALWNQKHPDKSVRVGDVITCVNGVGTDDSDLMRKMLDNKNALRLTVRCGDRNETRMSRSRSSQWSGAAEHDERNDEIGASEHDEEQSLGASRQKRARKCGRALRDFTRSPQGKVVELIGRSSVEWRDGAWSDRLSELCMRAAEETNTIFDTNEEGVLNQLYERITMIRKQNESRMRTKEEIDEIVAFWWKLQTYRTYFLKRNRRADTAEEVLTDDDIQKVKNQWKNQEMWWDLFPKQRKEHLPSYYNAALHNKSGWATVANAIIKYKLPQLPHMRNSDGVNEHIQSIKRFCCDLLVWLKKIASAALTYWNSADYEKARKSAGC